MGNDLFYTNMYSLINQWSDFKVSKNMYKAYFNLQKANSASDSSSDDKNVRKVDTSKLYNVAGSTDKLSSLTNSVTTDYAALTKTLEGNKENGTIDYDAAYKNASSFVDSYNNMMSAIGNSGDSTVSGKAQFMDSMTKSYARTLAKVGITINSDNGKLSIDEDTFKNASDADLKSVFSDKNSFGTFVNTQAQQLNSYSKTDNYTKTSAASTTASTSKTTASGSNTYDVTGAMSNLTNSGSILSMFA